MTRPLCWSTGKQALAQGSSLRHRQKYTWDAPGLVKAAPRPNSSKVRTGSSPAALLSAKPAGGKLFPFSHHLSAFLDPFSALVNVLPTSTLSFRAEWALSQPRVLPRAVPALCTPNPAATLSLHPMTCHCGPLHLRKCWHVSLSFISERGSPCLRGNENSKERSAAPHPPHSQGSAPRQPSSPGPWEADSAWHGKPPGPGDGETAPVAPRAALRSHPCQVMPLSPADSAAAWHCRLRSCSLPCSSPFHSLLFSTTPAPGSFTLLFLYLVLAPHYSLLRKGGKCWSINDPFLSDMALHILGGGLDGGSHRSSHPL